jgi:hypothetical protein
MENESAEGPMMRVSLAAMSPVPGGLKIEANAPALRRYRLKMGWRMKGVQSETEVRKLVSIVRKGKKKKIPGQLCLHRAKVPRISCNRGAYKRRIICSFPLLPRIIHGPKDKNGSKRARPYAANSSALSLRSDVVQFETKNGAATALPKRGVRYRQGSFGISLISLLGEYKRRSP